MRAPHWSHGRAGVQNDNVLPHCAHGGVPHGPADIAPSPQEAAQVYGKHSPAAPAWRSSFTILGRLDSAARLRSAGHFRHRRHDVRTILTRPDGSSMLLPPLSTARLLHIRDSVTTAAPATIRWDSSAIATMVSITNFEGPQAVAPLRTREMNAIRNQSAQATRCAPAALARVNDWRFGRCARECTVARDSGQSSSPLNSTLDSMP